MARQGPPKMPRKPPAGRARRVLVNAFTLSSAEVLSRVLTWATILFLARTWDLERYGQYALAVNWIALFAGLVGLGLNPLAIREVAYDRKKARLYLRNIAALRLALSLLVVLFLGGVGSWLGYEPVVRVALVILGLRLLFDAPASAYAAILQAHERMAVQGLVSVLSAALRAAGIILAVLAGTGILGAAWVWVGVGAFSWLALWCLGAPMGWRMEWGKFRSSEAIGILLASIPFAAFGTFQMFYYRIDGILLKSFAGNEAVALYDVAGRVLFVVFMVADQFSVSTLPALSAARDKAKELGRLALRSLKALLLLGVPLSVGGWLLGDPLMVFLFGEKYSASGPVFAVLSLAILFHFALKPCINLLAVKDPSKLTWLFGALFLLNLAGNILAIPRWGIQGAAWVLVACESLSLMAALVLTKRALQGPGAGFLRGLVAAVLASAVMGLGIHADPRLYWLILGPLVYGGGLLLLGGLDREDRSSLASVLGRGKPAR